MDIENDVTEKEFSDLQAKYPEAASYGQLIAVAQSLYGKIAKLDSAARGRGEPSAAVVFAARSGSAVASSRVGKNGGPCDSVAVWPRDC